MIQTQKVGKLKYVIKRDGTKEEKLTNAITLGRINSLVGSGGKTSTLYALGCELIEKGKRVTLTTTTKMRPYENAIPQGLNTVFTESTNGKLTGVSDTDALAAECDILLIEADGSRSHPIKMPAVHEPVVTEKTDTIIGLVGLAGIGRPIQEVCHRKEIVCEFLQKEESDILTKEDVLNIIQSPEGLMKSVKGHSFIVILNQADTEREIELGLEIASELPEEIQCVLTAYESID